MLPLTQDLTNLAIASTVPQMGEVGGNNAFFYPFLGSVMPGNEYDMLTKFLKLKPPTFLVFETEDAYEFILDCYERSYMFGY